MQFYCLSISYDKAALAARESLALGRHEANQLAQTLRQAGAAEATCLSTCNRVEIYLVSEIEMKTPALEALAALKGVAIDYLRQTATFYTAEAAIEHLFALACGLRSQVTGETEIFSQLKLAYAAAAEQGDTGRYLAAAFQRAFAVAKQSRRQSAIGRGQVSVASVAAQKISQHCQLSTARLTVWGAGTVGRAVIHALNNSGATGGTVLTRQAAGALNLPAGWQARSSGEFTQALKESAVFVSCTGAPHAVINREHLAALPGKLLLVDLAVPRDVALMPGELPNVELLDLDEISAAAGGNAAKRAAAAKALAPDLKAAAADFCRCLGNVRQEHCLAAWRMSAHQLLDEEMARLRAEWPQMPEEFQRKFAQLGRRLLHRMLHQPSVALNRAAREDLPCSAFFSQAVNETLTNGDNEDKTANAGED